MLESDPSADSDAVLRSRVWDSAFRLAATRWAQKARNSGGFGAKPPSEETSLRFQPRRGFVFQATMRASGVVVVAEVLDDSVGMVSI